MSQRVAATVFKAGLAGFYGYASFESDGWLAIVFGALAFLSVATAYYEATSPDT